MCSSRRRKRILVNIETHSILDGQGEMNGPDAIVPAQVRLFLERMEIAYAAGLLGDPREQHAHLIGDGEWQLMPFHANPPLSLTL